MDFHPLPERRLIMPLSGDVEIGTSDGSRHVFCAGDMRLMEDVTGRGHTHVDRSLSSAVSILLKDETAERLVYMLMRCWAGSCGRSGAVPAIVISLSCSRMRQERPTCRDVCGGAIAFLSHGKRTWQRAGEVRLMHHLWTPIRFEPSEPCAL
jgi:hypothetical protein